MYFHERVTLNLSNISEHFFSNHVWVVNASTKYHSFFCCVDLISKMLFLTLAMFWLSLHISEANTASRFWTAVAGSHTQLGDLLLIKHRCVQTVLRNQKHSTRNFLWKLCFVKSHKFFKKALVMKQLFRKSVSPHTSSCT